MLRVVAIALTLGLVAAQGVAQENWSSGQIISPRGDWRGLIPLAEAGVLGGAELRPGPMDVRDGYREAGRFGQLAGPVDQWRGFHRPAARSVVREGHVTYRTAEPGGTAFESGPDTTTTVIQRGPNGVAVTVIRNPALR